MATSISPSVSFSGDTINVKWKIKGIGYANVKQIMIKLYARLDGETGIPSHPVVLKSNHKKSQAVILTKQKSIKALAYSGFKRSACAVLKKGKYVNGLQNIDVNMIRAVVYLVNKEAYNKGFKLTVNMTKSQLDSTVSKSKKKDSTTKKNYPIYTGIDSASVDAIYIPSKPKLPDVEQDTSPYRVRLTINNITDSKTTHIDIDTFNGKNREPGLCKTQVPVGNGLAIQYLNLDAGGEYRWKVRAVNKHTGAKDNKGWPVSGWTEYTSIYKTPPKGVDGATFKVDKMISSTELKLKWNSVDGAESYVIEYATNKEYFGASSQVQSVTVTTNTAFITGLESGRTWYFRIKSEGNGSSSKWITEKYYITQLMGGKPDIPTTWNSNNKGTYGDDIYLYVVHNPIDTSAPRKVSYNIKVLDGENTLIDRKIEKECNKDRFDEYLNETIVTKLIFVDSDLEGISDNILQIDLRGHDFVDRSDISIEWSASTRGIYEKPDETWSDSSPVRTINVYVPPSLTVDTMQTDSEGLFIPCVTEEDSTYVTFNRFPMRLDISSYPLTQKIIGVSVTVNPVDSYETIDRMGNNVWVLSTQNLYSRYLNAEDILSIDKDRNDISSQEYNVDEEYEINNKLRWYVNPMETYLSDNTAYNVKLEAVTDAGLRAEYDMTIYVDIDTYSYVCDLDNYAFDQDTFSLVLMPSCRDYTAQMIAPPVDEPDDNPEPGEEDSEVITEDEDDTVPLVQEDFVNLSVYRIDYDGSLVLVGENIPNNGTTSIVDPYPPLSFARYRIIAQDVRSGVIYFNDTDPLPIEEPSIIIQWDPEYLDGMRRQEDDYSITYMTEGELDEPSWLGNVLKLDYNIDVDENVSKEVSVINYAGREYGVSYYGDFITEGGKWSCDIPADDTDTIDKIRLINKWKGDCYVREPSGVGYWATVSITFSKKHTDLVIPISINVVRVEENK